MGRRREMIDLHVYVVPSEIWRDKYNNMDNNDVSESISLGFIRIHPELRVYTLREEIEVQLNSPNLPQDYVFLKSVGRCLTKVKQHQEHQLKAKHFLPQLNSSLKYGNELYILETTSRGSNSSTSNSVLMSSDQRSSSNNDHVTGGRFRYQNGNSKPRNGTNYQLPFLQTSEKLKKLIRVGPPHQTLKHVNPNLFDPPTSNSDASFVSPTYQLGSKLVDDSNYYLDDVATGNMYRTPPSLSLTPTKHQSRRRRRRLHAGLGPRNPTSRNIAGGDDENDDDENDDDDSPMLHSYSEPPYHPHSHLPSAYIHSYPYFIDDMMMLPLSGSPRHTNRRSQHNNNNNKHNNNNNNNNDDIDDDDESNNNNNNNDRRSRSPPTMAMSLPANPSQRSTRRSKEKPKAAEDFTATTTATTTMTTTTDPTRTTITTDGKEGDDESKWNLADEKRLREMRARQELKREQEEQERWERLDSEQQNIELGLIRTEQQQQQQHDGRDSEATNKDRHQQHQSPRAKNEADAREEKQQEGKGEDEKGEDEEGVGGEELEGGVDDEEREEEEDKSAEHDTEQRRSKQNNYRPELNTGAATSLTPVQKTSEPETARSRRKDENEKLYEMLESVREQRKSKERQREELVKRAKSLQAKVQNRRNHARDMWKKKYYEEKKRTSPLEEQCNKQRHELDVIHRKYISSLEPAREKPTKITAKKPSEKNNILIQASRLKHDTDELRRRVDNAKMKLTAELKLRNQTEIELRALKGELIQQKINLNLIRKQQLSNVMNQGGAPATQDILISLKQPIVHTTK